MWNYMQQMSPAGHKPETCRYQSALSLRGYLNDGIHIWMESNTGKTVHDIFKQITLITIDYIFVARRNYSRNFSRKMYLIIFGRAGQWWLCFLLERVKWKRFNKSLT